MRSFKKSVIMLWLLIAIGSSVNAQKPTIYTIGDSTMADKENPDQNPEVGWCQVLPEYFTNDVKIDNRAVNGRSTRSFIDEGRWDSVLQTLAPNDYVFIQFGHNDQKFKDPTRFTNPFTGYKRNLMRYVNETRAKGAIPILFTSLVRRNYNEYGTLEDTHGDYPLVVTLVAKELNVPLIDLQWLTEQMEESYGVEASKKLHLHFAPGEHPYFPEGKEDDTHLSVLGANEVCKMVVAEIKRQQLDLANYLK